MHNMNGLEGKFTGRLNIGRMKLLVLVVLALFLVCTAPVVCLTGEEAINMAIAAEDNIQCMTPATQDDINVVAGQADEFDTSGIVPQQSTQIIDGVEHTVYEYTDPVTGEALTQVKDSDGNIIRSEYRDPESNTVLTTEYENGQVACTTTAYNSTDFAKNISAERPATSFPVGTVSGNGSGELLLTFTVRDTVPVSSGRYSYDVVGINIPPISTPWNVTGSRLGYAYGLPGLYMPNKPNNFTVTAEGVKNLNIGLKKLQGDRTRMWVTTQIGAAENGRATAETDLISPGPYHAKIFGDAAEDASQVNLIMTMVKKIVVEGRFSLSLDTTGFPSGEYMIAAEAVNGSFSFDEIAIGGLTVAG